jgi:hypothetical protein
VREPAAGDAAGRARRVECRRVHLNPPAGLARRPRPNSGPRCRRRRRRGDRVPAHASGGGGGSKGRGSGRGRVKEAREQRIPRALGDRHGAGAGSELGSSDFLTGRGTAKPGGSVRWMLIAAARASAAFVRAGVRPAATRSREGDIRWLPGLLGQPHLSAPREGRAFITRRG